MRKDCLGGLGARGSLGAVGLLGARKRPVRNRPLRKIRTEWRGWGPLTECRGRRPSASSGQVLPLPLERVKMRGCGSLGQAQGRLYGDCGQDHHERGTRSRPGDPSPISAEDARICLSPWRGRRKGAERRGEGEKRKSEEKTGGSERACFISRRISIFDELRTNVTGSGPFVVSLPNHEFAALIDL